MKAINCLYWNVTPSFNKTAITFTFPCHLQSRFDISHKLQQQVHINTKQFIKGNILVSYEHLITIIVFLLNSPSWSKNAESLCCETFSQLFIDIMWTYVHFLRLCEHYHYFLTCITYLLHFSCWWNTDVYPIP